MPELKSFVAADIGLHARAAAAFVRAVNEAGFAVTIRKVDGDAVDAGSLLEVMTEDFGHGCGVLLEVPLEALEEHQTIEEAQRVLQQLSAVLEAPQGR
ncbi:MULTISPECIES: HPr family phosphocarrier protein [unclassified Paenarthrobacter]|uniref:HPr family phosphocarrier protein n=1 Tax=unclassified Paenarthrobacter TaxID=2634190 RepID=UPI003CEBAFDC